MQAKDLELPSIPLTPAQVHAVLMFARGLLRPITGFLDAATLHSVRNHKQLPNGEPWGWPLELIVDKTPAAEAVLLRDGEGRPLGVLRLHEHQQIEGGIRLAGTVQAFEEATAAHTDDTKSNKVAYVYEGCLHKRELQALQDYGRSTGCRWVLVRRTTFSETPDLREHLTQESNRLAVAQLQLVSDQLDLPNLCDDISTLAHIARNLGASRLLVAADERPTTAVRGIEFEAFGNSKAQLLKLNHRAVVTALQRGDVEAALKITTPDIVKLLAVAYPPPRQQGATLLFTGLSGAGKSTIAKALAVALMQRAQRPVSLLDGDLVRLHLSKGLGFDRIGRETNLLRIAFVAQEINRHGGLVICAPIAPYAATRTQMRQMIEQTGRFIEVHIATPIEVCEQRDPKGLYASARAGRIGNFTGVGDEYEVPENPDLRIDTSQHKLEQCVEMVMQHLVNAGFIE